MRPLKFFQLVILFLIPVYLAYSQSDTFLSNISYDYRHYDEILQLLGKVENEEFNPYITDYEEISRRVIGLSLIGQLDDENTAELEADIYSLLYDTPSFELTNFQRDQVCIIPAVYYSGKADVILCQNYFAKKWKQLKKFAHKYKKPLVIGGAIVVSATTVIVGSYLAEKHNTPPAHPECGPYSCTQANPSPASIAAAMESQTTAFKERIIAEDLLKNSAIPLEETGRIIGQVLTENTLAQTESSLEWQSIVDEAFSTQLSEYQEDLGDRFYHLRGQQALDSHLYDEAIEDLNKAIALNPDNSDAYLDRAFAHLKLENKNQTLADYEQYNTKKPSTNIDLELVKNFSEFEFGFYVGGVKGIGTSIKDLLSATYNISVNPLYTLIDVYKGLETLSELAENGNWKEFASALAPETTELVKNWRHLTLRERGEKAGFIIGNLAGPPLVISKGVKAAKQLSSAAKSLKKAQKALTIEAFAQNSKLALVNGIIDTNVTEALITAEKTCQGKTSNIAKTAKKTNKITEEASLNSKGYITESTAEIERKTKTATIANAPHSEHVFKFTQKTTQRMHDPNRAVPLNILKEVIDSPLVIATDPQNTSNALMYYSQMHKNGKLYNIEVLYDKNTNTILHFQYTQKQLGPLNKVSN